VSRQRRSPCPARRRQLRRSRRLATRERRGRRGRARWIAASSASRARGAPSPEALALLTNPNVVLDADGVADIRAGRIDPRIVAVLTKLGERSYRPDEIGTPWAIAGPGYFTDAAHQDNIHVAFKQPIDPWWTPPA
jgi:hypothetical protein